MRAAENVAYNYAKGIDAAAAKAVDQWIHSPGHEKNMRMNGNNIQAVAAVRDSSNGKWFFCQFFANA